jgi:hypothetical protein
VRAWPLVLAILCGVPSRALGNDPSAVISDSDVLGRDTQRLEVQAVTTRLSAYDQYGKGYQSKAGPILGPGSERLTVLQPQAEIVITQGEKLTHRLWIPIDVISAASPNSWQPVADVVSGASRKTEAGTLQWTTTYKADASLHVSATHGLHLENPFRSWNAGVSFQHAFADQNTVVSAGFVGIFDWFDRFYVTGARNGRTQRSTTMGSAGLTQVLTPTTVVNLNYGLTVQAGELGNTWNAVPLASGERGPELLPNERIRHAIVGRMAQFLPWNGAVRLHYRLYADDWGILAHSIEGRLMQRLTPKLYVGALYRFHTQTGPHFFTTLAPVDAPLRVADSDLAPLDSHTIGAKLVGDTPVRMGQALHYEVGYDRYFRTNDLQINIVTCSIGLVF